MLVKNIRRTTTKLEPKLAPKKDTGLFPRMSKINNAIMKQPVYTFRKERLGVTHGPVSRMSTTS